MFDLGLVVGHDGFSFLLVADVDGSFMIKYGWHYQEKVRFAQGEKVRFAQGEKEGERVRRN